MKRAMAQHDTAAKEADDLASQCDKARHSVTSKDAAISKLAARAQAAADAAVLMKTQARRRPAAPPAPPT